MSRCPVAKRHRAGVTKDGREVYHCLRWCNRERREYWFCLDARGIMEESRGTLEYSFDARNVPAEFRATASPIEWVVAALDSGWNPGV